MSARSEPLFAAQKRIMNPFLLCAVTSARARQLMMAANGQATLAELLDSVLSEVASGALEFQVEGPGYSSAVPTVEDTNVVPALGQAEKTEERISVSPAKVGDVGSNERRI
jgi:DNA-directed RNA polymerase subunit K/omega